jgi:hypothetical protein
MIRGKDPVRSQATELLRRHRSPEHAALNIKAAELLWRAGYNVDIFPFLQHTTPIQIIAYDFVGIEEARRLEVLLIIPGPVTLYVEPPASTATSWV